MDNNSCFHADTTYGIYVDNCKVGSTDKNVFSIEKLAPGKEYTLELKVSDSDQASGNLTFNTETEYVRLNVSKFGAAGDGIKDDTLAIQAAIMACPENSTVYFPAGIFRVVSIFLKSNITIELHELAVIKAIEERERYAILPGFVETTDELDEYYLGSWEGNPLDTFTSVITGINVQNVTITGTGTVDGNASQNGWWHNHRIKRGAWRPKTIFLTGCKNITLEGIKVINSPSWTIHPLFCEDVKIFNLDISNPPDSPNTDGIDPESCVNVQIIGTKISVGDDCLVIKSGKIYLGKKLKRPSSNFIVRNCLLEQGHGAVVIGSEIAGGVNNVTIEKCIFSKTDKGLRIKTRRGRGKNSIISGIKADNIIMDEVEVPIAIYAFYFCDPDGKSEYVGTQDALPVDERTPVIKDITFSNIKATNAHIAAAYINGLPEKKIEYISIENVDITFSANAREGYPAMITHCDKVCKMGFFVKNVAQLNVKNLKVTGANGDSFIAQQIDKINKIL
jgi:polygalacturonase